MIVKVGKMKNSDEVEITKIEDARIIWIELDENDKRYIKNIIVKDKRSKKFTMMTDKITIL